MGKSKGKKGKDSTSSSAAGAPKCSCDHPYNCSCGNRPPRPSKGHKWDPETQQWGGKGHKQKGASGQTASKAQEAKTTDVGKTTISQWQKLPANLLDDVCKKDGRPRPKYKQIGNYRFRVIVQDAKPSRRGTDHDLIMVPASGCDNEEQAKQEAALLALLHLTPTIPHERKLPEPYKTTWLNAVDAAKQAGKALPKSKKPAATTKASSSTPTTGGGLGSSGGEARASANLTMATSFVSRAEKKRQDDERRKARAAKFRKLEAIRMANRDHQVFLSARTRKHIETLLRGESIEWEEEDDEARDDDEEDEGNELKAYVVARLNGEGFTRAQARTAFGQIKKGSSDESAWDEVYDGCLQWLCINLDEDQLPEGFDPRGRTLDVLIAPSAADQNKIATDSSLEPIASKYGLSKDEAIALSKQTQDKDFEQHLWNAFLSKAEVKLPSGPTSDKEANQEMAAEELEAIEAIFDSSEFKIDRNGATTSVLILLPSEVPKQKLTLQVTTMVGEYPAAYPTHVFISGEWSKPIGTSVHVELIKFLESMPPSEPMIYELFGKAQSLLGEAADGELPVVSLSTQPLPSKASKRKPNASVPSGSMPSPKSSSFVSSGRQSMRRPRERAPFWSLHPSKTPAAEAFPITEASIKNTRASLPAAKARDEFLSVMQECEKTGRVVLVTGDTGCGKTTQIPQYILENAPKDSKIVVAQPRRLAATGVAGRVAAERGEHKPGTGSVGYVVRGDTAMCRNTRLVFCTTGVLLRQLQSDRPLDSITHIIVDEVHERHLDTDVLLGVLKGCLATTPHLRVVLMSATLDADRFAAYWGAKTPRMHIPGRTFPVEDYFLEDVLACTGYIPPKKGKKKRFGQYGRRGRANTPWADSEKSDNEEEEDGDNKSFANQSVATATTASTTSQSEVYRNFDELTKRVDETNVDYDMVGLLVKYLVQMKNDDGSILVFLSGAPEINNALNTIRRITQDLSVQILPLHGGLQPKDQNLVFRTAPHGCTKVILSTNVAETSVTIPDCTVVIDSCREKQSSYDPVNRMPLLLERFASKASLKQRRGRAGRVREGTCYKLISKTTYAKLREHGAPEIHRCALDQTLLSLMFLGVERGSGNFLRTLLDPPSQESLDSAILSLQRIGAVSPYNSEGSITLTPLGMHLAGIPAPPTVGKMLVMGAILGCRTAALAMAAGMSVGRSPFLRIDNQAQRRRDQEEEEESMEEMKRKRTLEQRAELFKTVGNSDHALLAAAYMRWDILSQGGGERKRFCDLLGLSFNGMRDMKQLVRQLDSSLSSAGYISSVEADRNCNSWRIIRACAVAALAPSQIVRVQRPSTKYAETAEGAVEKDGESRELKFYIVANDDENKRGVYRGYHGVPEERVFMHPSSTNFKTGNYSCPWLVYHELVRTSKPFLRDATECSAYALLLFGGSLDVQAANGLVVVENWVRLSANARIGSLIGGLRKRIDELLAKKVEEPTFDITGTVEMKLVRSLLVTDGMGH